MGEGQFRVDTKTLRKLSKVDSSIVQLVRSGKLDDVEFKERLTQLIDIVKTGKLLKPNEVIQSDIILPSPDLSIEQAKKLFKADGVIPEI